MARALAGVAGLVGVALATVLGCGDGISQSTRPSLEVSESGRPIAENGAVIVRSLEPALITLANTGTNDLMVYAITLAATPPDAFQIVSSPVPSDASPVVIGPGMEHDFRVIFDASKSAGERPSATVSIKTSKTISGDDAFVFKLTPEAATPRLLAQPALLDFQVVQAGQSSTKTVRLLNTGAAELQIAKFFLSGHPGYQVHVAGADYPASATTSSEGVALQTPLVIGIGAFVEIEVKYTASGSEKAEGELLFMSNDPASADGTAVKLYANVAGPCITVNPDRVEFGGKLIGTTAVVEVEVTSCGDRDLEIQSIAMVDDGGGVFGVDTSALLPYPIKIAPNESRRLPVTYLPKTVAALGNDGQFIRDLGHLEIESNAYLSKYELEVSGFGTDGTCPTAVITCMGRPLNGSVQQLDAGGDEVLPQTTLSCSAGSSTATSGQITGYQWSVRQPQGSNEAISPSATRRDIEFAANIIGTYVFSLDVWDQFGVKSCSAAQYQVIVMSDEAIHVELLWRTPGDINESDTGFIGDPEFGGFSVGSDVDLHVLHPEAGAYFDDTWDTNWLNPNPNWGGLGANDDPSLDRDDTDGAGPENFNLAFPEFNKTYAVGAHYWDDWGYGIAYTTVRVYIYGQLRFNWNEVPLTSFDMWDVCEIDWPTGNIRAFGGTTPVITPNYPRPF